MKMAAKSLFPLACFLTLSFPVRLVQAQSYPNLKTWQISQKFKPRVDNKPSPVTDGGATRGKSCLMNKERLIPLTPANLVGSTLAKYPTFFWYMPSSIDNVAKNFRFTIFPDGNNENLYEVELAMPKEPGIVSFTLPENAPPLEINRIYQWSVTMICDSEDFSGNPRLNASIERIQPDSSLIRKLQNSPANNLSKIYGDAGIWYEGLNAIAKQRCTYPNNRGIKLKWKQFLESVPAVESNDITSKKLINSCLVNNR